MKTISIITFGIVLGLFAAVWQLSFDSGKTKTRIGALEAAARRVQQPQDRHLFDIKVDTLWRLENSDSAVIYQNGRTRKIVTFYYGK